jgi:hypothetical protein
MNLPVIYASITSRVRKLVREEYARRQGGNCALCGESLTERASEAVMSKRINARLFPPNFFKWPVHLHHCHVTGLTVGAIHCRCNAVLWQYHNI